MSEWGAERRQRAFHFACLTVTPWIQLLINPNLFVTPGGNNYIDPWLYTGFFIDLPELLQRYPGTYYGARLSWLLPGYAAHQAFPPLIANYVLHLTFFYALLAAVYALVAAGSNRQAAILTTLVMAWNPTTLTALSWDYVDGAGIVFVVSSLLCLEMIVWAEGSWRWAWSVGAGLMMACMISSNLFLVILWPVLALFLSIRLGLVRWRQLALVAVGAFGGLCGGLAFFGFVNTRFGGPWLFFEPQLRMAREQAVAVNPWRVAGYGWLVRATWLVLPAVATIAALIGTTRRRALIAPEFARAIHAGLLLAVALWTGYQFAGAAVLQFSYYTSYLAPFALLTLCLQAAARTSTGTERASTVETIATLAVLTLAHALIVSDVRSFWQLVQPWLGRRFPILTWGGPYSMEGFATMFGLGAGLLAIVALFSTTVPWHRWMLFLLAMALMSGTVPPDLPSRTLRGTRPYFEETVNVHRFIKEHVRGHPLRIWSTDPRGTIRPIISVASTYLWEYSLLNYEFPELKEKEAARLTRDTRLVLLVPRLEEVDQAREPLRRFGFEFDIIAQREFGKDALALAVVVANLR